MSRDVNTLDIRLLAGSPVNSSILGERQFFKVMGKTSECVSDTVTTKQSGTSFPVIDKVNIFGIY